MSLDVSLRPPPPDILTASVGRIRIDFIHVGRLPISRIFNTPAVEHELSSCGRTDQSTTSSIRGLPGQSAIAWSPKGACADGSEAPVIQNTAAAGGHARQWTTRQQY